MIDYGRIIFHAQYNSVTDRPEVIRYEWSGGDRTEITAELLPDLGYDPYGLKLGDAICIGPYTLRVIDTNYATRQISFLRDRGLSTTLRVIFRKWFVAAELIYRRLVITLAVWRLARFQQGAVPTWRDVHVLRWLDTLRRREQP